MFALFSIALAEIKEDLTFDEMNDVLYTLLELQKMEEEGYDVIGMLNGEDSLPPWIRVPTCKVCEYVVKVL